ncbi:hypothetical protein WOLCODRAFT_138641 [Wolfiporia cocos MD-104 SS10]|uniref:Peptidase A22B signal peptide peptidase n=1 Tax=Wolfiporia cocos (strain MD-104) TaxID=742152 RepID=A0A2H3JPP0_WOLCO|nr:hypothetical protein WOLCODRAFT_138641 [Wolfiporia cocos MD-104 SS10]
MSDSITTDWDLLSSYAGLLTLATISIYAGSYGSVTVRRPKAKSGAPAAGADDEGEEEEEIPERLSSGDAYLFPIIGSVVLFGLYLVVKYFGKEWINWFLQWYFTVAGIGSVGKSLISLVKYTLGSARWKQFEQTQLLLLKGPREIASLTMRTPSWFLLPLGALPSILYSFGPSTTRRSALLTDILALSFSHNALALLKIDSFKTGCVLLSGLFLYDIWWVFGTEVMVKVATTLDIPIKIVWPKSLLFSDERGFTMLGLGDIVVPGLFIALALRYDYYRAAGAPNVHKTYFYAAIFAYVAGLATTMFVMHYFRKAQPALLYLSPACIASFVLTSLAKGDFKDAWAWSDDPEKQQDVPAITVQDDTATDILPAVPESAISAPMDINSTSAVQAAMEQSDSEGAKRRGKKRKS